MTLSSYGGETDKWPLRFAPFWGRILAPKHVELVAENK